MSVLLAPLTLGFKGMVVEVLPASAAMYLCCWEPCSLPVARASCKYAVSYRPPPPGFRVIQCSRCVIGTVKLACVSTRYVFVDLCQSRALSKRGGYQFGNSTIVAFNFPKTGCGGPYVDVEKLQTSELADTCKIRIENKPKIGRRSQSARWIFRPLLCNDNSGNRSTVQMERLSTSIRGGTSQTQSKITPTPLGKLIFMTS